MYYGLTRKSQLFEMINDVIDTLKSPKEDTGATRELLISTIGQETHLGDYKDPTDYRHGTGLAQVDPGIPFKDIIDRSTKYHKLIKDKFDIDLKNVQHRELELSPLLSIVLCRLKYKLVPKAIPKDSEGQWEYYKKWYNSYLGKATKEEYMHNRIESLKEYSRWEEGRCYG